MFFLKVHYNKRCGKSLLSLQSSYILGRKACPLPTCWDRSAEVRPTVCYVRAKGLQSAGRCTGLAEQEECTSTHADFKHLLFLMHLK